jgi:aerobic carbon-monoxide dehydrogenase medium subunit
MRLEEFQYHAPGTIAEATHLLAMLEGTARVVAGGTDLLADMKQGKLGALHVVSLAEVADLRGIEETADALRIGPLTTPNRLADSPEVRRRLTGLADAASVMAGTQIRNLATIGGNLASAVPSGDLPPSLLTASAVLELASEDGVRTVPLSAFFLGPRRTDLKPKEILSAVVVPHLPDGSGSAYEKFQLRDASALAVVGVAARLTLAEGVIAEARVAVGAAAPTPVIIEGVVDALEGREPTEEAFLKAGAIAAREVKPISDIRGSAEYRRDLVRVLTVRALQRALDRSRNPEALSC